MNTCYYTKVLLSEQIAGYIPFYVDEEVTFMVMMLSPSGVWRHHDDISIVYTSSNVAVACVLCSKFSDAIKRLMLNWTSLSCVPTATRKTNWFQRKTRWFTNIFV